MTNKKETRGFSNFGFSTILLSFVMICVITFSALSLVTAHSDYKLSQKVADKNQLYFEAESNAYERLISIDTLLMECYTEAETKEDYYAKAASFLKTFGELQTTSDAYMLSFQEPIAENQHLSVVLQINYPTEDTDTFFKTLEWKSVYTKENLTFNDETLNLIQ